MRLIDSDALLLKKFADGECDTYEVVYVDEILDAPTVDAVVADMKRLEAREEELKRIVHEWMNEQVEVEG